MPKGEKSTLKGVKPKIRERRKSTLQGVSPKLQKRKVLLAPTGAGTGNCKQFKYHCGPVVNNPQVFIIFLGDWSSTANKNRATRLSQFMTDLLNSKYMNILSQYGCGSSGNLVNSVFIANTNQNPSDADIQNILQNAINNNTIPEPTNRSNVYIIYLDDNTGIVNDPSGGNMCESTNDNAFGYHSHFATTKGNTLYYGIVPGLTDTCLKDTCPGDDTDCSLHLAQTQEQRQTQVTSHEFSEMISDPEVGSNEGWSDQTNSCCSIPCHENGDICNGQSGTIIAGSNTWTVQKMYSKWDDINSNGATMCITESPNPLPSLLPSCAFTMPAVAGVGNNVYFFAKSLEGRIFYNRAVLGQGGVGWEEVEGGGLTDAAPAAGAVGTHVFVAVKGLNADPSTHSAELFLNQADLGHPFNNFWNLMSDPLLTDQCAKLALDLQALETKCSHILDPEAQAECIKRTQPLIQAKIEEQKRAGCLDPLLTDVAPAVTGVGDNVYFFAKHVDGRIFYNRAKLGQGGVGWVEVEGGGLTDAAPAAGAVGTHVFVAVKGLNADPSTHSAELFLNQADLGQPFGEWFQMGFSTDVAPAVTGVGDNVYFFAKHVDGRIFYNRAKLGQGGVGWVEVEGDGRTDAAPAAGAVGTHVFVAVKGLDGKLYLNQADLGQSFGEWFPMS